MASAGHVGGAATGESFETLMREGFDFIQLGRALLYDPDLPRMWWYAGT